MYLLFTTDHKQTPDIGDGSKLRLTKCEEGYFCESKYKAIVEAQGWNYTEAASITPIVADI